MTFQPVPHQGKVTVQIDGCYALSIKVGQHWQPALVDNDQIEQIINHLFHIHPGFVAGAHPMPGPEAGRQSVRPVGPVRPVSPIHPHLPDSEPGQP